MYPHTKRIKDIFIHNEQPFYAVASEDCTATFFNCYEKRIIRKFRHPKKYSVDKVAFAFGSPACFLLYSNVDKTIYSYSINGQLIASFKHECSIKGSFMVSKDPNFLNILSFIDQSGAFYITILPFVKKIYSRNMPILSNLTSVSMSKDRKVIA